ncbi:MAG: hypothetical protein NT027_16985 [Proteobacteria bacterium]|nr:hypothetical protein [Pseudomonadota bacterium]
MFIVIALLLLGGLIATTIWFIYWKRRQIAFIESKLTQSKKLIKDASEGAAFGVGVATLSILELYSVSEDHEHFREVMSRRFNHEMGDADMWDWLQKAVNLDSSDSLDTYARVFAGQAGEDAAVAMFEQRGITAVPFEERNHPDNDILVTDADGNVSEWSVKSYDSLSNFKSELGQHPESTNYVVNDEIFEKLESSGDLAEYKAKGIEIVAGGFSHDAAVAEGAEAMSDIADSADITDEIPIVAGVMLAAKTLKNVSAYNGGKQSIRELGANITADTGRIGVASAFAFGGAKVGALVGTFIAPGVGTFIGGCLGGLAGSIGAGMAVASSVKEFKWGDIRKATLAFGCAFENGFTPEHKLALQSTVLKMDKCEDRLEDEQTALKYEKWTLLWFVPWKPNPAAVLSRLYLKTMTRRKQFSALAIENATKKIFDMCTVSDHPYRVSLNSQHLLATTCFQELDKLQKVGAEPERGVSLLVSSAIGIAVWLACAWAALSF